MVDRVTALGPSPLKAQIEAPEESEMEA
jgi:hypothetical protein